MLENLGFDKLLLILAIAVLFFGAKRLPEIGSALGKGIREFRKSMREVSDDIDWPAPPTEPRSLPRPEDHERPG